MKIEPIFKYDGNSKAKFAPEQIDNLFMKNIFTDEFEKCEHLGWDEDEKTGIRYDFGTLTDCIDFSITENETRIYSGEGFAIIGNLWPPFEIQISPERLANNSDKKVIRHFSPELIIPERPQRIADLMIRIVEFRWHIRDIVHSLLTSGQFNNEKKIIEFGYNKHDDLPF